jgi:glycosyltransferase involved in cell wall biosynthesis
MTKCKKRLRLLVLESSGNLWGSERSLIDILQYASGVETAVCCPANTPFARQISLMGIKSYTLYISDLHLKTRFHRAFAALGFLWATISFRPDVIYVNQAGSTKGVIASALLFGIPVVCHVRLYEDIRYLDHLPFLNKVISAFIAISASIETEMKKSSRLCAIPIHQLYDGHDELFFPIIESNMTIACVGRIVPIKGQELLLDALAYLQPKRSVKCVFIGDGSEEYVAALKNFAENNDVEAAFLGFREDVGAILSGCAALVCPSYKEPLGRVIFDAWAAGTIPVVYSQSGGAAEVVSKAEGGIIYINQSPEDIADAIILALLMPAEIRATTIENGRRWLKQQCDPKLYAEKLVAIFRCMVPE